MYLSVDSSRNPRNIPCRNIHNRNIHNRNIHNRNIHNRIAVYSLAGMGCIPLQEWGVFPCRNGVYSLAGVGRYPRLQECGDTPECVSLSRNGDVSRNGVDLYVGGFGGRYPRLQEWGDIPDWGFGGRYPDSQLAQVSQVPRNCSVGHKTNQVIEKVNYCQFFFCFFNPYFQPCPNSCNCPPPFLKCLC